MKTTSKVCRFAKRQCRTIAMGLALMAPPGAWAGDIHLDMLKTRTDCFTNVTVYSRSKTEIFIRHEGGIANIKLEHLDPQTIAWLNSGGAPPGAVAATQSAAGEPQQGEWAGTEGGTAGIALPPQLDAQLRQQMAAGLGALNKLSAVQVSPAVVGVVLGVIFASYLFLCYCLKLICQKTGNEPGFLIWLPLFQMIPLFRAANMSAWCFLGLFVPVVNLIVQIVWCFKIVQARRKSALTAIGLLLPVTNLLALLYLAFSNGKREAPSGYQKVALAPGPLAVEA